MIQLAFQPKAEWVYRQSNGAAYNDILLPINREYYARRLYILFSGGSGWLVDATIQLTLNGQVVYTLPYIKGTSSATTIRPAGDAISSSNPGRNNALQVTFGANDLVSFPWTVVCAADTLRVKINSSTVVSSAMQFIGIHSEMKW